LITKFRKLLFVFGTRPEALKMAPLIREFREHPALFEVKVCVSGQQREMLDQALSICQISPDYDLNIMQPGQDLCTVTSRILSKLDKVLEIDDPDMVIVQGDTTTSLAASISAFYRKIPITHIEAGLRTFNKFSPWPEEMNRCLTSQLATWHFAPTVVSKNNLLAENIQPEQIMISGNTIIDELKWMVKRIESGDIPEKEIETSLLGKGYDIHRLKDNRKLILITGHRRESFGKGFQNICHAIRNISLVHPEVDLVFPVHLNPNVREPVHEILGEFQSDNNIFLLEPLDYPLFVYLLSKSYLVLTDSGGIQEEAPAFGLPVLLMRDTTERPEGVEAGTVRLVGTKREEIEFGVSSLLNDPVLYKRMSQASNPYGDGNAAKRIVDFFISQNRDNDS